jgi:hypothetical protein
LVLVTIFYCLKFETSLFVASYDSQGHGGGIRPRLHTGETDSSNAIPSYISPAVANQQPFCYNRFWGNAFVVPGNTYATVYCYNVTMEAPAPDTLQYIYIYMYVYRRQSSPIGKECSYS